MWITLTLETNGAAFDDAPGSEVARILREVADRFDRERPTPDGITPLRDVYGNAVGQLEVEGTR